MSGLGLLMGKYHHFFACHMSVFSFPDNNLSKYQWFFTKLGVCIDVVEIGLRLIMGKYYQFLTVWGIIISSFLFVFNP